MPVKILTIPFARDAQQGLVNAIPDNPVAGQPQLASWKEGFRAETMMPLVAGGIPPQGQDFNGLFQQITEHLVHQNSGGQYGWSQEWVDAHGGYPAGAVVFSDDGLACYYSAVDNNAENFNTNPASIGVEWLLFASVDSASNAREWVAATVSQVDAEAGVSAERKAWTAERVRQAADAAITNRVVDTVGQSDSDVMSQKAVTDRFALVGKSFEVLKKEYPARQTAIKKTSWNTVSVRAGTIVNVHGTAIEFDTDTPCELQAPEVYVGAIDYAVIVLDDGTAYSTRDSYAQPASVPANGVKIGGYHFGRTAQSEAPSGNKTEADMVKLRGIREQTIWDLRICPINNGATDNRGMARIAGGALWENIYLDDSEIANRGFSSPWNLTEDGDSRIAGGVQSNGRLFPVKPIMFGGDGSLNYAGYKWWHANEIAQAQGKRLPFYSELTVGAYGVEENASMLSLGKTYNTGVQAYVKELMSADGIEHATGSQYQWTNDLMSPYAYVKFEWRDKSVETDGRGNLYMSAPNNPTALRFGGRADTDAANVGSRTANSNAYLWNLDWNVGARSVCDCSYL